MARQILISDVLTSNVHKNIIWRDELVDLVKSFGPTAFYVAELELDDEYFRHWHSILISKNERRGEVALFVRNNENEILVHKKPFYPAGITRIPTGGLHPDEKIIGGLKRELKEETGFAAISMSFDALLLYEFSNGSQKLSFPSFMFSIEPDGEVAEAEDESEQISGFFWADVEELNEVVARLHALESSKWRDWGRIRAIPHEIYLSDRMNGSTAKFSK